MLSVPWSPWNNLLIVSYLPSVGVYPNEIDITSLTLLLAVSSLSKSTIEGDHEEVCRPMGL